MYTLSVPAKPFVAKYIYARYQAASWELNKNEKIGKVMYNMMQRIPKKDIPDEPVLGATFNMKVSYRYAHCHGIYLSPEAILEFNDYIRLELIEEIMTYIANLKTGLGMKKYKDLYVMQKSLAGIKKKRAITDPDIVQYFEIKEIIYDIFKKYNITEDDYAFETINKDIRRLKLPLLTAS